MHTVKNFALGLVAAAAVASASDVVQLSKDSFNDFVKGNDIVLAECKLHLRLHLHLHLLLLCSPFRRGL